MNPAAGPSRVTRRFAFTLRAGSEGSEVVGPVQVGSGPLEVTLSFSGDFVILACVGTRFRCIPMGGRPQTTTFGFPPTIRREPFRLRFTSTQIFRRQLETPGER